MEDNLMVNGYFNCGRANETKNNSNELKSICDESFDYWN